MIGGTVPSAGFMELSRISGAVPVFSPFFAEIILVSIVLQERVLRSVGVPQVRLMPE